MNVFQKIMTREIAAEILFENERVIAFYDIKPQRPGHFLVVPKVFSANMMTIADDDLAYLIIEANRLAKGEIARRGVKGYNIVVNNGAEAGQEVFHTHIHVIPTSR